MNLLDILSKTYAPLVGRIFISAIFLMAGLSKIGSYEATAGYMQSVGLPGALLPLVILTEAGGALLIVLGYQTRLVAFLLAGFSILSAIFFHANFADQTQSIMFMKNVAMAGGFLFLVANGAGPLSLDNRAVDNRKS